MSNSRVARELKVKAYGSKAFERYKKKEDFITNYQMARAYLGDRGANVMGVIEKILSNKYNLPWQMKYIRIATRNVRGKRNPIISIPKFNFECDSETILSKFVHKNFSNMVANHKDNDDYPITFTNILNSVS